MACILSVAIFLRGLKVKKNMDLPLSDTRHKSPRPPATIKGVWAYTKLPKLSAFTRLHNAPRAFFFWKDTYVYINSMWVEISVNSIKETEFKGTFSSYEITRLNWLPFHFFHSLFPGCRFWAFEAFWPTQFYMCLSWLSYFPVLCCMKNMFLSNSWINVLEISIKYVQTWAVQ